MNKVVLVTGGFDPLHSGHIAYFKEAKKLGDMLIVGVNSDEWLTRKKGQPFMNINERIAIVKSLAVVDAVIVFDDKDGSACEAIKYCLDLYSNSQIIFANGGDRTNSNIPEMSIESDRLSFVFGLGGEHKMNSSSKILTEWKTPKTERKWGYYRVLHSDGPSTKVKELVVEPGKSLSLQKHKLRNEHWIVTYGTATVKHGYNENDLNESILNKHDEIHITKDEWHQLINNTNDEIRITEIQYGINCIEEDILRI
jgi:D-beta-D-heptose 7-phosphate kinase/D-beta-D-heptose 1-phosphate adenosyltransferase